MSVIEPKKMVSRTVAIALGMICVVLVAGIAALVVVISARDSTIQTDNDQIKSLSSQYWYLYYVANMHVSEVIFDQNVTLNPREDPVICEFPINYSGYIGVSTENSNLTSTWIEVDWYYGTTLRYHEIRNLHGDFSGGQLGTRDIEYFPVVGSGGGIYADVQLGNDRNETTTFFVTVTYYY